MKQTKINKIAVIILLILSFLAGTASAIQVVASNTVQNSSNSNLFDSNNTAYHLLKSIQSPYNISGTYNISIQFASCCSDTPVYIKVLKNGVTELISEQTTSVQPYITINQTVNTVLNTSDTIELWGYSSVVQGMYVQNFRLMYDLRFPPLPADLIYLNYTNLSLSGVISTKISLYIVPKVNKTSPYDLYNSTGLIGRWHFDDALSDSSGKNHNLSLVSNTTIKYNKGEFNNGTYLNGKTYYNTNNITDYAFIPSDKFTLIWWINTTNPYLYSNYPMLGGNIGTNLNGYQWYFDKSNNKMLFSMFDAGTANVYQLYGNNTNQTTGHPIFDGKWHQLIISNNGSELKYRIDTILTNDSYMELAGSIPTTRSSSSLLIGNRPYDLSQNFSGYMDEIQIYNRELNQTEIDSTYFVKPTLRVKTNSGIENYTAYWINYTEYFGGDSPIIFTAGGSFSSILIDVPSEYNQTGVNVLDFQKLSIFNISYTLVPDDIFPLSITNNQTSTGNFWTNNTWTNPIYTDLSYVYFAYANGTSLEQNVSTPIEFLNLTWSPHYVQNISAQTVDVASNMNTTLVWFNATIANNAPILNSIGSKTIEEDLELSFSISGTDVDSDILTYTQNGSGTLNSSIGAYTWTPATPGTYYVNFSVNDSYSGIDHEVVEITVMEFQPTEFMPNRVESCSDSRTDTTINMTCPLSSIDFITDSLNITRLNDNTWHNGSIFWYQSGLSELTQYNYRVYSYNSSGNGSLNLTYFAYNVTTDATPPTNYRLSGLIVPSGSTISVTGQGSLTGGSYDFGQVFLAGYTYWVNVSKTGYTSNNSEITFGASDIIYNVTLEEIPVNATPIITSWGNNNTNNESLTLSVEMYENVLFNFTSNQTLTGCTWTYSTQINCSGLNSYAYKNFSTAGSQQVTGYGINTNGSTQTLTWNVEVNNTYPTPTPTPIGNITINATQWQELNDKADAAYNLSFLSFILGIIGVKAYSISRKRKMV